MLFVLFGNFAPLNMPTVAQEPLGTWVSHPLDLQRWMRKCWILPFLFCCRFEFSAFCCLPCLTTSPFSMCRLLLRSHWGPGFLTLRTFSGECASVGFYLFRLVVDLSFLHFVVLPLCRCPLLNMPAFAQEPLGTWVSHPPDLQR